MQFTEEQIEGAYIAYRLAFPDHDVWPFEAILDAVQCKVGTRQYPWNIMSRRMITYAPVFARYWHDPEYPIGETHLAVQEIMRMLHDTH